MEKRIAIGIVAYNAESTLQKVLDRIPDEVRRKVAEVIVFDDESRDATYAVAREYQREHPHFSNLTVFRNPNNLGYGGNQKRCYRYCIDRDYDIVVLLHGDGQYAPECLPELLAPLEKSEADAVFGSRMMIKGAARKGGMPLYKYVGNKILSAYENRMLGMDLTEFHSGYRLYSIAALKQVPFEKNTNDFHFDTEIIVQFHAGGLRIKELAIPTYYGDEICRVNGLKYAWDVFVAVLQFKLHEKGLRHYAKYEIGAKHYAFKRDRHSSHGRVIALVPEIGQKILDVGCGPSDLSRFLKKKGNQIFAVDRFLPPPEERDPSVSKWFEKDLDRGLDLPFGREFDVILFLDVLEHLRDPESTLAAARRYLKKGGRILLSLPNVAHWSVRLQLLFGLFQYGEKGILDRTHLHFYTLRTARQMVRDANYRVVKMIATPMPLTDSFPIFRNPFLRWVHALDVLLVALWKRLFGYQFIFVLEDTFASDPESTGRSV